MDNAEKKRIQLTKNQFAELITEVDGLCPMCSEELLIKKGKRSTALSQAAHIYPHSPSAEEEEILRDVPKISEDSESVDNLIMLCPNCHNRFDHPRTREGYLQLYSIKLRLVERKAAKEYYRKHSIEDDIISVLMGISNVNVASEAHKLSYKAMTVESKMNGNASATIKNAVIRDVRDFYLPIQAALQQLEKDHPGKSDMIAKEMALFYFELKMKGLSQDNMYSIINDWLDAKTQRRYTLLTPYITAFYVQNCEVFS